jgi:predicted amidohydrolase YtcJ
VRFQIHTHAVRDRAVREYLNALEGAVRAHPDFDGRHQIAHAIGLAAQFLDAPTIAWTHLR